MAGRDVRRLRPELYEDLERVPDRRTAERMEEERAIRLAEAGFAVHCDGVTRTTPNGRIRPFANQELAGIADLFDGAVFRVIAQRTRPQTRDEIVSVLRWEKDLGDIVRTPWNRLATSPMSSVQPLSRGLRSCWTAAGSWRAGTGRSSSLRIASCLNVAATHVLEAQVAEPGPGQISASRAASHSPRSSTACSSHV